MSSSFQKQHAQGSYVERQIVWLKNLIDSALAERSGEMFFQVVFKNDQGSDGNFLSSAPAFAEVLKHYEQHHPDYLVLLVETKLDYWDNDGEAMHIFTSPANMLVGLRVLNKASGILGYVQRILHTVSLKHVVKNAVTAVVLEEN